jgi:hypothetical protein
MRKGFDQTVKTLTATGVVDTNADAVLINLGRTLADSLDREVTEDDGRPYHVAQLTGKLLDVVDRLRGSSRPVDGETEALAGFLASLHDADAP